MAERARLTPPRTPQVDWPWHRAKFASLPISLLGKGDRRMEAENYLASGFGTRLALEAKPFGWVRMQELAGTSLPSRLKGTPVLPVDGTPYLAATQIFDSRPAPRRWLATEKIPDLSALMVDSGQILVTRSGDVGRSAVSHKVHSDQIISDDLLRVVAKDATWWGWIYAYLRAPSVRGMMKASQYGHIIKHLEPAHLDSLPVLKLRADLRLPYDSSVRRLIALRDEAHAKVLHAEQLYENAIGGEALTVEDSIGFTRNASELWGSRGKRLEAGRFNPTAEWAERTVLSATSRNERLGDLVRAVFVPGRFKHIYGPDGMPYLDSAQILENAPDIDKHVLSLTGDKRDKYLVQNGTILIPCSGQIHGIIGSVVLAAKWHENKVLTNHIMRIVPGSNPRVRMGYLVAVLGHPRLGRPRVLRNTFGSSVPELAPEDIADMYVPRLAGALEGEIADLMEDAAKLRSEADEIEERIAAQAEGHVNSFLRGQLEHLEA